MKDFERIYIENKKLDEMFDKLYDHHSEDTIEKNIVELLVELGELANETRCFKYWSNKKPSSNNMANIDLNEPFEEVNEKNIVTQFKQLYKLVSTLDIKLDRELIKEILSNLANLGILLDFSKEEIVDGCLLKINKNKSRFDTGF